MITFKKADFDCLELYNQIPMKVLVTRIIEVKEWNGLAESHMNFMKRTYDRI